MASTPRKVTIPDYVKDFNESLIVGININDGQPGAGYKTSSFVEYANDDHKKTIVFFSSNHEHIREVEEGLKKELCLHLKGFVHLCPRYPKTYNHDKWTNDEKLVHDTYKITKKPSQVICPLCEIDNCPYSVQFNKMRKKKIILSPLEFLNRKDVVDIADEYHFDESIKKIRVCNFGVDYEKLDRFAVDTHVDYGYVTVISKLQKEMLRQTSVLLTQPSDVLMNFTNNHDLYKGRDYEIFYELIKMMLHTSPITNI